MWHSPGFSFKCYTDLDNISMKSQGSSSNISESSELYNCTPLYVFSKSSSVLANAGLLRVLPCQFPLSFFSDRDMGA